MAHQDREFIVGIGHCEKSLDIGGRCGLCIFCRAVSVQVVLGKEDATNLARLHTDNG